MFTNGDEQLLLGRILVCLPTVMNYYVPAELRGLPTIMDFYILVELGCLQSWITISSCGRTWVLTINDKLYPYVVELGCLPSMLNYVHMW